MGVVVVGVDPGQTGAFGLIDLEALHYQVRDMPLHPEAFKPKAKKRAAGAVKKRVAGAVKKRAKGKKKPPRLVDGGAVAKMLRGLDPATTVVVIEKVGVMTGKESRSSMFNFGNNAGAVRGAIEALGFVVVFVTPQEWKAWAGLIGTAKDASRVLAIKKYPTLAKDLKRKRDGGRADAICIAAWYAGTRTVH
jgi:hypothetical protein